MEVDDERPEWGKKLSRYVFIPQRYIMAVMAFFSIINNYTLRTCLSVTMTELVVERETASKPNVAVCPPDPSDASKRSEAEKYEWSQSLQGYILGAFYIGYILGHLPAGLMSEKWGAKWILTAGMGCSAFLTLITPVCIKGIGPWALITLRIIMGFGSGFSYPCCSALLAQWVPVQERSLIGAFMMGGGQLGTVLGNSVSGFILQNSTWEWVFYTFGICAVIWLIFFVFLCYSDPRSHPYIGDAEKIFLLEHMGRLGRDQHLPPTPWVPIFKTKAIWALISAQCAHDWGFYVMITDLPKFMKDVMQFSIQNNGIFSAVPFLTMWIVSLLSGWIADIIIKKDVKYAFLIRIIMTSIAALPSGIFMVMAVYAGCNRILVIAYFTICMSFMGSYYAGVKLTPNDMSPNYAATLMAIVNGSGALMGVLAPYSVGWMTPNATMEEWRVVCWVALIVLTVFTIPFCVWGTAEVQEWNEPDKKP